MQDAWDPRRVPPRPRAPPGRARPAQRRHRAPRAHATSRPLAAGLVNMEVSRGDGSLGTVIAVQGGLALRTLALFGSPAQQERVARPGRTRRGARRRSRSPSPTTARTPSRSRPSRARPSTAGTEWVLQRREEVDRQRRVRRHHLRVGARRRPTARPSTAPCAASSSSRSAPATPAPSITRQGVAARHPSGAHRPRRRARAARRGAAGHEELQGCLDRAVLDPLRRRVVGARARDRLLRGGAHRTRSSACSSASRSRSSRWCRSASRRCSTS